MSEMSLSWLMTVAVVVLATIGVAAMLSSVVLPSSEKQGRAIKLASVSLTSAGLILMVDGIVGLGTSNAVLVGLFMMVFGSSISPAPTPENADAKIERDGIV